MPRVRKSEEKNMTAILIEIAKFVGAMLLCMGGIFALLSPVLLWAVLPQRVCPSASP